VRDVTVDVRVDRLAELHAAPLEHTIQVAASGRDRPVTASAIEPACSECRRVVQANGDFAIGIGVGANGMNVEHAAHAIAVVHGEAAGVQVDRADERGTDGTEDALEIF
jgi:hypothetical protein